MKLDKKSKDKLLHIGAIIFLICTIILFIIVIFIVLEIDLDELISGKDEISITVENHYDKSMKVICYVHSEEYTTETETKTIASGNSYTFKIDYIKSKEISDVHIYAWDSRLGDFVDYVKDFYVYPEGKPFNLYAIINENGEDITITKNS